VDIIFGSNHDEGSFTGGFGPPTTAQSWRDGASQRWGDLAEMGLAAYPAADDEAAAAANDRLFNDNMAYMMRKLVEQQRAIGVANAYSYYFVHQPPYDEGARDLRTCHTCEIRYVFKNLDMPGIIPDVASPELASTRAVDRQVSDIMSSYWVNFAKTGDPNGPGLPEWPQFETVADGPVLEIDANPKVSNSLSPAKVALYDALYARQMAGE
jgi:para-nitrobenzyl esterase